MVSRVFSQFQEILPHLSKLDNKKLLLIIFNNLSAIYVHVYLIGTLLDFLGLIARSVKLSEVMMAGECGL